MQDLLTTAHSSTAQGITALQSLLSTEELELFEAGRMTIDRSSLWTPYLSPYSHGGVLLSARRK